MKSKRDTQNIIMIIVILVSFSFLFSMIANDVASTKMERKDYQMFKAVKLPEDTIK